MRAVVERSALIQDLRIQWDKGDIKFSSLGYLFDIADTLHTIDPSLIPAEWEFQRGAGRDLSEQGKWLLAYSEGGAESRAYELVRVGNILHRYLEIFVRGTERDY